MDANEQRAHHLAMAEECAFILDRGDAGDKLYAESIRAIAALAQQVPADGEWVLVPREATPAMIEAIAGELSNMAGEDVSDDYARKAYAAMLAATQQAPQPVVDDNGLIVHGDWYTVEHTGTHIFDLDDDRERLLSILLYSNGDVGFAARVEGVGSWQGKATDPVFREALAALGDPRRHDLALGTNPPASQPQQGAVAWEVSDGIAKSFAWKESDTAPWRNEPGYTIRPLIYGDTIGQQAVDDVACVAIYDSVTQANFTRDVKSPERKAEIVRAALAAHGKGETP